MVLPARQCQQCSCFSHIGVDVFVQDAPLTFTVDGTPTRRRCGLVTVTGPRQLVELTGPIEEEELVRALQIVELSTRGHVEREELDGALRKLQHVMRASEQRLHTATVTTRLSAMCSARQRHLTNCDAMLAKAATGADSPLVGVEHTSSERRVRSRWRYCCDGELRTLTHETYRGPRTSRHGVPR